MGGDLQAPLEHLADQAYEQIAALRRAQGRVRELTVSAATPDGLIRVNAGVRGDLREVRLEPEVYQTMPPGRLAATITGLAQEAAAEAGRQAVEIMAPVLPAGLPAGTDLTAWLPDGRRSGSAADGTSAW